MDEHALRVLEFHKLKDILSQFAVSPLGREAIQSLAPSLSLEEIRFALREVTEMVRLWETNRPLPLEGFYDIRESLGRSLLSGAMLDPSEILIIGETCAATVRIRKAVEGIQNDAPHIQIYGRRLIPHPEIEKAINKVFDEKKQIRDSASHELSRVRKSIHLQRGALVRRLERLMRGRLKDYMQESYYTQREGRYVLPIDARYQNKLRGIIHDRSTTGTTVFIEPLELVEDGNRLKSLHREEEIEIRKILCALTALIGQYYDELLYNLEIFRQLDLIAAKARFSFKHQMNAPVMVENTISIVNGRHPLLLVQHGKVRVVPLNLRFEPETRGLVITGPNTGGKTVVLKTIGLLALMAQCGMHIPADDSTELPVFRSIGADIGDEQSLEQSLSTFSSHITNIRSIIEKTGSGSLVLLDELGSGTDPAEGGALAGAILKQLHEKGAMYFVTTHLQDLKVFAHQTEGVENGSMEFDLQSLQPTFAFTMGLPGQSNAIQIAGRLGLPDSIIQDAKKNLQHRGAAPEDLLTQLGEELRASNAQRQEAEREFEKAKNLRIERENRMRKARNEANDVIQRAERKAQGVIRELERRLEQLDKQERGYQKQWKEKLERLVERSSESAPAETVLTSLRGELEQAKTVFAQGKHEPVVETFEREDWSWDQLKPNVRVRIGGLTEPGTVTKLWPDKGELEVSVSSMNLRIKSERVLAVLAPKKKNTKVKTGGINVDRPQSIEYQLDIHGMTVDEMTPLLQKFIDHAFLSNIPYVIIVHGHGTGTLRRAVRQFLKDNPVVTSYENGSEYEGGSGVTVARFQPAGAALSQTTK